MTHSQLKRKKIEVIPGDVRDKELITKAMKKVDIVLIAALIGIPYSYKALDHIDTNINGILNILNAARELKQNKLYIPLPARYMVVHNQFL